MNARRSYRVRPVTLQGRLKETRYQKSDDGLLYQHDGDADLWLVETDDGRRATLALPRHGDGWKRDGATYWLTNSPDDASMSKPRKRAKTTARKTKRPPPRGFKTWAAYMASIRPNGGRKMATRKRRASSSPHKRRRRRSSSSRTAVVVARSNPPRRRRHARRNPPFSIGGIVNRATAGAVGGAVILATEVGTKLARSRLLGMPAGTITAGLTEAGVGLGASVLGEKFVGPRVAQLIADATFASIFRTTVKQLGISAVNDVLSDTPKAFAIRNGRVVRRGGAVNGYVGGARLGQYVGGASPADAAAAMVSGI